MYNFPFSVEARQNAQAGPFVRCTTSVRVEARQNI